MRQEITRVKTLSPYIKFTKFRLSFLVVISAISGYLFVGGSSIATLCYLSFGGMLVTAASNGVNQILEKNQDALMHRTQSRPLVTGEISITRAVLVSIVCLLVGSALLFSINLKSMILGLSAFVSYALIYTPMKAKSSWSV